MGERDIEQRKKDGRMEESVVGARKVSKESKMDDKIQMEEG